MIHVELNEIYNKKNSIIWCILSFKAGLLNAAGFLIAGSYVSHVTGFGTQVGVAIGHHEYDFGMELLIIPFAFISGSTLVSYILDRNYNANTIPDYPFIQLIITSLIGILITLFSFETFSIDPHHDLNTISLIGLLCFICGLKNALTTWSTYGKIRTTHVTGLATDIGLHCLKLFYPKGHIFRYPESRTVNIVRILTLFSFSFGSFVSALFIPYFGHYIFHFAFIISIILLIYSIIHRQQLVNNLKMSLVFNEISN